MSAYTLAQVAEMTGGEPLGSSGAAVLCRGASIDSRRTAEGEIFFALAGARTDGHRFLEEAFRRGAAAAVVRKDRLGEVPAQIDRSRIVAAGDPAEALRRLAARHRDRFAARVIAVTGTNGKTTTKELLAAALREAGAVSSSPENWNTVLGASLALLRVEEEARWAVMELGISAVGEMASLASIVRPDAAVFTNIGPAHLEGLGSVENTAREKCLLLDRLAPGGAVYANGDDPLLLRAIRRTGWEPVTFGLGPDCAIRPERTDLWGDDGIAVEMPGRSRFQVDLYGNHQVTNLLAAIAAARGEGLAEEEIARGLRSFAPSPGRFRPIREGGVLFIDDTYNANFPSTAGAIEFLARRRSGRRHLLFGDMLELGAEEEAAHRRVGKAAGAAGLDRLWLVGERTRRTAEAAETAGMPPERIDRCGADREAWAARIAAHLEPGDALVAKGSRAMEMERILEAVRRAYGAARGSEG